MSVKAIIDVSNHNNNNEDDDDEAPNNQHQVIDNISISRMRGIKQHR